MHRAQGTNNYMEDEYDMADAIFWLEDEKAGLKIKLSREFRETINYIKKYPEHLQKLRRDMRPFFVLCNNFYKFTSLY